MAGVHADRASRGKEVLGVGDAARSLTRITYEIAERNNGSDNLVIAGIPTRGAMLARRLVNRTREVSSTYVEPAIIDTTMYRDDSASQSLRALEGTLVSRTDINGKTIVLVDDVLYTGHIIKVASDAFTRIGHPGAVQFVVLIDRGHRELPTRPDYVGKNLSTSHDEIVTILLDETDGRDDVLLGKGLQTISLSHLTSIRDLTCEEVILILGTAEQMAATQRHGVKKLPTLQGKTVVNLFFEDSTCTRTPFETTAKCSSTDAINFQSRGSLASKGESLKDTALTLEAMSADMVAMCHSSSGVARRLAHAGWMNLPVLSTGDGTHQYSTQALLDAMTLRRHYAPSFGENGATIPGPGPDGVHVVIVGDVLHSHVARSNVDLLMLLDARVTLVAPPTLLPIGVETWSCTISYNFDETFATHPGAVMMPCVQREYMSGTGGGFFPSPGAYHAEYGLTPVRSATLSPNAVVTHPGPVNRGLEVYAEAAGSDQPVIVEQVSNGVCTRMAALYLPLASEGHSND